MFVYTSVGTSHSYLPFQMDLDSTHPFSKAFDYASDQIGRRFQNPLYPLTEFLFGSRFRQALAEVRRFGRKIITKARQERSKAAFESLINDEEPSFDTLIDSLMEAFRDPTIVADSALNFLSAGKDTTAQSFTWTLYAILRHPEVLKPLLAEIKALQLMQASQSSTRQLTLADLQPANLPFLLATYYEALRLYPPIPFEIQECQQDVTLPDGTFLPRSSVVVWCIWAINRAKEIHGEDADGFRPERWLDQDGKFVSRSASEFPVFNGGPRSCLGRKMTEVMAAFILISMLPSFRYHPDFSISNRRDTRRAQNSLTLPMADGLPCQISVQQ